MGHVVEKILNGIVITHLPINTKNIDVFKVVQNDVRLEKAIEDFGNTLGDVEIFDYLGNVIATEQGYYCAFYENQLKKDEK